MPSTILLFILGCVDAGSRPLTAYHDDAGFLVAQMRGRGCVATAPCAIWDARLHADGPQTVALGRGCASCEASERDIRVFGHEFDGVTGVLAEESPLLVGLHTLGCYLRDDCEGSLHASTLVVARRGGEQLRITLDD